MSNSTDSIAIVVPARFWDDHSERAPSDYADARDICIEVRRTRAKVWLDCTPEQLENLRGDAEHYSHPYGPDETPSGIRRSAQATLKAINAQVAA